MNSYLIPANAKRGKLIFGLFREIDLIIFGVGLVITFILLAVLPLEEMTMAVLALVPGLFCTLLVAPVPYYHNILCLIVEAYEFFTERQRFVWKGWCFVYDSDKEK